MSLFITASSTGLGKTLLACLLITELRRRGSAPRALKPVVTGFDPDAARSSDSGRLLEALGAPIGPSQLDRISPWRFRAPLSPDMAAAREQRSIPFADLVEYCRSYSKDDATLIEGVGGVMVPLDAEHTVLDWIAELGSDAVLVTGSYLGAISHTLTALTALASRGVAVRGIVVSESLAQPVATAETARSIERFSGTTPVLVLPRLDPTREPPGFVDLLDLDAWAHGP